MRNPASQGRTDANQRDIANAYRELHCSVFDLHMVGSGCPDLLVGISGTTCLVEVKLEDGKVRPSQATFHRDWRGEKPVIVRTVDDVIAHVRQVRAVLYKRMSE